MAHRGGSHTPWRLPRTAAPTLRSKAARPFVGSGSAHHRGGSHAGGSHTPRRLPRTAAAPTLRSKAALRGIGVRAPAWRLPRTAAAPTHRGGSHAPRRLPRCAPKQRGLSRDRGPPWCPVAAPTLAGPTHRGGSHAPRRLPRCAPMQRGSHAALQCSAAVLTPRRTVVRVGLSPPQVLLSYLTKRV